MNERAFRRSMEDAGCDPEEIEDTIDRLADDARRERSDSSPPDAGARLVAQGYDLDQLEKDNPHNRWMYT